MDDDRRACREKRILRFVSEDAGNHRRSSGTFSMMALERSYAVVLEPEAEGGYSVHIPAFRGAHTQGESYDEAVSNARDVIALHMEVLAERGEAIPPSDMAITVAVSLPSPAA